MAHKKYTGHFVFCEAERHAVKQKLQSKLDCLRLRVMRITSRILPFQFSATCHFRVGGVGRRLGIQLLSMNSKNDGVRYLALNGLSGASKQKFSKRLSWRER